MSSNNDEKKVKDIMSDVGHNIAQVGEKAKPFAEKIGKEIMTVAENSVGSVNILNTVIEGAYEKSKISDDKGVIQVGEKEISAVNCESYEAEITSEEVEKSKEIFENFRRENVNLFHKLSSEKYLLIKWRNGEESIVCVDAFIANKIIKILS